MKLVKVLLAVLVVGAVLLAITPIRKAVMTFVHVDYLKVGTEDSYVWLPSAEAKLVRLDGWTPKEMVGTPVLVLTVYNGSDWNVGGVDVTVANGNEKRSFRCTVRTSLEYLGTFVSGAPTFVSTKEAGVAVCDSGNFAKKESSVTISGVYGWKP